MHFIPEFMGMRERWLHFERPSVCSLFDYSSEQMQTDRKIKTWNWPTTYSAQREKYISVTVYMNGKIRLILRGLCLNVSVQHTHAELLILTCIYWYFCRYLKDFFISMIDMSWSLTLCSFAASFFISWLLFAIIWYFVVLHHGELNIKEIFYNLSYAWINLKCYKNKSCLVLDAWCAMCCILSAHVEGQKLITANFFA